MKQRLKDIFQGPVVFYPLLFAVFPILFLYDHNISETSASQMWLPLAISVAGTVVLWAILSLILGSLSKGGLATAIFLFLFFSYGRFYELLENWDVFVPSHGHLLPTVLFIFGYCVYFIKLARRGFRLTTKILNIMAVALIAINLVNIGFYQVNKTFSASAQSANTENVTAVAIDPEKLKKMPDIYFIILDEYAHPDTMKEWYDYDNSQFIKSLEDKGFFIAGGSKSRTMPSPQSIAQTLNMEYLTPGWNWNSEIGNYIEKVTGKEYREDDIWNDSTFEKLACSKVANFLRMRGYQYAVFGNQGHLNKWGDYLKDNADVYFNYYEDADARWVSDFNAALWNMTMLRPFYHCLVGTQYETAFRRQTLYTLDHLKTLPEEKGPKFVYAHFCCPHQPFVFGPNGEYIAPANWVNYKDKQFYRGQYIFISNEIEKVIDALLKKTQNPPIIILQSDHGIRPHLPGIEIGSDEWQKILNAMYLPGMDYTKISDSISPVNTFRLIFNHYFDGDYEMLPDDWEK